MGRKPWVLALGSGPGPGPGPWARALGPDPGPWPLHPLAHHGPGPKLVGGQARKWAASSSLRFGVRGNIPGGMIDSHAPESTVILTGAEAPTI